MNTRADFIRNIKENLIEFENNMDNETKDDNLAEALDDIRSLLNEKDIKPGEREFVNGLLEVCINKVINHIRQIFYRGTPDSVVE